MTRLGAAGFRAATLASYATVGGQAIRTLVLARILNPATFGVLNITNVASNLTVYADLGTGMHGERLAAEARGRRDLEQSKLELIEAAGARMLPALALGVVLGVSGAFAYGSGRQETGLPLVFLAISAPLMALWMACRGWLHVHGQLSAIMWCQISQVVAWLTVVPVCAILAGLPGALYSMAASYIPPILIAGRSAPVWRLARPRWAALRRLVGHGVTLWLIQLSTFAFVNVDQAIISITGGNTALGHYAIAMLVASALAAFSDGAALSGHVKTLEQVARQGHLSIAIPSVTTVMHTVQAGFGLLIPCAWLGAAGMIHWFLPQYYEGLPVVALLGAGMGLVGVVVASNSALLSVERHRVVPAVYLGGVVVKVVTTVALLSWLTPILSVAVAALAGSAVVAVVMIALLSRAFEQPHRPFLPLLIEFLSGGFLLSAAAAVVVVTFQRYGMAGFVGASAAALVVSAAAHAVLYVFYLRRRQRADRDGRLSTASENTDVGSEKCSNDGS